MKIKHFEGEISFRHMQIRHFTDSTYFRRAGKGH